VRRRRRKEDLEKSEEEDIAEDDEFNNKVQHPRLRRERPTEKAKTVRTPKTARSVEKSKK
jgi:hypothetical protein